MKTEKSCGCIILKDNQVLLIGAKDDDGKLFWSFPKGHQENGETDIETAIRETKEETGLDVEISDITPIKTGHFVHGGTVYKNILLFIAKPLNYELKPQEEEVEQVKWIQINGAGKYFTDYYSDAWKELLKRLRVSILQSVNIHPILPQLSVSTVDDLYDKMQGMNNKKAKQGIIIIPGGRKPWPHELRIANILAMAGHNIEFLSESNTSTADILLDGIEYEVKSPFTNKPDKLERNIKRGLKQSKNIIFDSSRIKNMRDDNLRRFLTRKVKEQKQIGKLILITKRGQIIDIKSLV